MFVVPPPPPLNHIGVGDPCRGVDYVLKWRFLPEQGMLDTINVANYQVESSACPPVPVPFMAYGAGMEKMYESAELFK